MKRSNSSRASKGSSSPGTAANELSDAYSRIRGNQPPPFSETTAAATNLSLIVEERESLTRFVEVVVEVVVEVLVGDRAVGSIAVGGCGGNV